MKAHVITLLLTVCMFSFNRVYAQLAPRISTTQRIQAINNNWYDNMRKSFLSSQVNTSSRTVVAQRSMPGGKIEIGTGFTDSQTERVLSSNNTTSTDGLVICKTSTKEIDLSIKPELNIIKASSQTQIFPGMMYSAQSVLDESFVSPAGLPVRKPMRININLLGARQSFADLTNPGTIQMEPINRFISANHGLSIPAMLGQSTTEVNSRFEFASKIEASSGIFLPLEEFGIPAQVNAGNAFSGNTEGSNTRKTYLVKFVQPMFVLFHDDRNPANLFQDPGAAASRTNVVMVNSVTYGRMVFMRIVSEASAGTVKAALESKFGITLTQFNIKAGNSLEGSGTATFSSVIKEFKAVVVGGNLSAASSLITNPDQLVSYINDPNARTLNAQTNAVPISFTLVRVSDYASLGVRTVGTFQAIDECRILERFNVYIKNFGVSKVVDNPLTGNNEDLYGTITVQAFFRNAQGAEVEIKDDLNRPAAIWNQPFSNPLQLKQGEKHHTFISGNSAIKEGVRSFKLTPEQVETGYLIIKYRIRDKIMQDGEQIGNSNAFVKYEEKDFKYFFKTWRDLKDAAGCTYELKEVGGDATLCINFSLYNQ